MVMSSFAQSSVFKMFTVNKKTEKSHEKQAFSSEFLSFKELFRKALFWRRKIPRVVWTEPKIYN